MKTLLRLYRMLLIKRAISRLSKDQYVLAVKEFFASEELATSEEIEEQNKLLARPESQEDVNRLIDKLQTWDGNPKHW